MEIGPEFLNEVYSSYTCSLPSLSLPDMLCVPTNLILRKGTPFEAMTGRAVLHRTVS